MSTPLPEQTESLEELVRISPYDNSISFLYKQAIRLNVPVRFVLIKPQTDLETEFIDVFDLDENEDAVFTTIFQFIEQLLEQNRDTTLLDVWELVSQFQGDRFNHLELIPIWFTVAAKRLEPSVLLEQVNNLLATLTEPTRYSSIEEIIGPYNNEWLPKYQEELYNDLDTLREYARSQREIAAIRPVTRSNIDVETVTITYEYATAAGINPLPDIFNEAETSYIVPFIQYNIKQIKGQAETVERYYKIYKGRSIDARPNYNNVALTSAQASRGQTIYLNVWTGPDVPDEDAQEDARTGKKESFNMVLITYIPPPGAAGATGSVESGTVRVLLTSPHTDDVDENVIIDRVHSHIQSLTKPRPETVNEVRISGSFKICGVDLSKLVLFDLITNDPVFSKYLYLEESVKSFAEKTRLNIHYRGASTSITKPTVQRKSRASRSGATVSAAISEEVVLSGDVFSVYDPETNTVTQKLLDQDRPVLNIKMTRATSRRAAQQFANILSRLFRRYIEEGERILATYLQYVPEYQLVIDARRQATQPPKGAPGVTGAPGAPGAPAVTTERMIRSTGGTPIQLLQKYAPDLFVSGYARRCQREFQPLLIRPEEIPVWQERRITKNGVSEPRQILGVSPVDWQDPNREKYYFVCPNDNLPYPRLNPNTTASKDLYPFVPCCGKRMHAAGRVGRTAATPSRGAYVMKSDKALRPGRLGFLPTSLITLLSKYEEDIGTFHRFGLPRTPNSFIHCVALAVEDAGYMNARDKEAYVSYLRENLFTTVGIRPELLRQELHDMTNEDIIDLGTDNERFFDPLLFYRALEVLFRCNIYIFSLTDKDRQTGRNMSYLQLPRHKYFHAHIPVADVPVVLIIRNWGAECDTLEYPQCELIVNEPATDPPGSRPEERQLTFNESMNEIMYPALMFVGRTLTWQIVGSSGEDHVPELTCRMNVYSSLNYEVIFGDIPIVGQVIDSAGKARIFALSPELEDRSKWTLPDVPEYTDLRILANVPPTSPLNVPEFSLEQASGSLPPYNKLIELFGDPISATRSTDQNYLTGLWFPIGDIQFGFYCPCQDYDWLVFSDIYPNINTGSEMAALTVHVPRRGVERSAVQRVRNLRRAAKFIEQIIKYLYLVAGRPQDIDAFIGRIGAVMSDEDRPDSSEIYDISNMPRILPHKDKNTVDDILATLSTYAPQIFIQIAGQTGQTGQTGGQTRLLMYDRQMVEGILYQLKRYARLTDGLDVFPAQLLELRDYYASKEDFNFSPKTEFLLASLREYNFWMQTYIPSSNLQQRLIQNLKDNVQTRLRPNVFSYQEPYIYQKSGTSLGSSIVPRADKFYLIQNVAGGELLRAINVAFIWYTEKRNPGFVAVPYATTGDMAPGYVVYRISPNGGTIVEQNNSRGEDRFLEILDYGNDLYAAMLPIL